MAVDVNALWDEIRDLLNDDVTLQGFLGGTDRVVVGYSTEDSDIKVTAGKGLLLVSTPELLTNIFQSSFARTILTAYSSYQEDVNKIIVRASALLDGYLPTVAWCQQMVSEGRPAPNVSGVSNDKQQLFVRETFVANCRRI